MRGKDSILFETSTSPSKTHTSVNPSALTETPNDVPRSTTWAAAVSTTKPTADLAHITGWALQHGIELDGLSVESVTLEDVYLRLVGTDS